MDDLRRRAMDIVSGDTTWYMRCAKCKTALEGGEISALHKIKDAKAVEAMKPGFLYFADNYFETYEVKVVQGSACRCKSESFHLWVLPDVQILSVLDRKVEEIGLCRFPINPQTNEIRGGMRNNNRAKDFNVRILMDLLVFEGNPETGDKLSDKVAGTAYTDMAIHRAADKVSWTLTIERKEKDKDFCAVLLRLPTFQTIENDSATAKFLGVNPR